MSPKKLALLLLALLPGTFAEAVEEAVTTPLGAVRIDIPVGPSSSMIGIPIKAFAVARLPVAGFTGTTLTFAGTPLGSSNLALPSAPFFVSFVSGKHAGRFCLVTANTANSVTVSVTDGLATPLALDTAGFSVVVGDKIEIIPGDTLATLFGVGANVKLVGAGNGFTADTVGIWNGGRFVAYFYRTTPGYECWVSADAPTVNANDTLLYPEQGLSISRKNGRPAMTLTFVGTVPAHRSGVRHPGLGSRVLAQPLPVPVPLSYFAFASQGGLNPGSSGFTADTVGVWNGGRWVAYYRNNSGVWLTSGSALDQKDLLIPPGQAVTILRRQSKTGESSLLGEFPAYLPSL